MRCVPFRLTTLTLVVTWALAAGSPAAAQVSWKVYDLRDLTGLMTPKTDADATADSTLPYVAVPAPSVYEPVPRQSSAGELRSASALATGGSVANDLISQLCDAMALTHTSLLTGVFAVEAEEGDHARLVQMLDDIRRLYVERYEVEIVVFMAPPGQAPSLGDPATPTDPMRRHSLVVARRTPTPLVLITRHSYVADLTAVVATGSVAHDPEIGSVEKGLRLSVLVGARKEEGNTTSLQIVGELRQVALGKMAEASVTPDTPNTATVPLSAQIELPAQSVRSIQSDLRVEYGRSTVVAVSDGFDRGECLVIAASVRKLED